VSSSSVSLNSSGSSPISFSGLASGLDTSSIIAALMASERQPVTRLDHEQSQLHGQQQQLRAIQSSLQQLSFSVSEFTLPTLFQGSQSVSSSDSSLVSAVGTGGAGEGGYEVEVTHLARAAQVTFTFASPASEQQLTIGGRQYTVKAGETAKELAGAINSDHEGAVYAATLEGSQLVLSSRRTGASSGEAIQVGAGGALTELQGSARAGQNAEFSVDEVSGSSESNTVTNAIAGVTLTLSGLTASTPVTIDVGAVGASVGALETQVQAFVKLYNTTVESIQKQLATRPSANGSSASELEAGQLYQDSELSDLLANMRQAMYQPIAGLPEAVSSPASIGISTGAPSGSAVTSQATLEGQLKLEPAALAQAVQANPAAVQEMLQKWSLGLQQVLADSAQPGGGIEARLGADEEQVSGLARQISSMNEVLAQRERALQQTYAELESVISVNTAQASWLTSQEKALAGG
jgi:flagellar hook-associated protein 2